MGQGTKTPLIMGVINVTPDSFSDGGQWFDHDAAIEHGKHLLAHGAQILDIGGESTRPDAKRVALVEEQRRVVPVIRELAALGATISIDTMNAETARAAIDSGASYVNDVSGGLADPDMIPLIASSQVQYVAMHWRGRITASDPVFYQDVVTEVIGELSGRVAALLAAGVAPERIILDPGLGFSKNAEHNWQLLANLPRLSELGYPLLIGASRKRFIRELVVGSGEAPLSQAEELTAKDAATAALSLVSAQHGVWGVRVHNVSATRAALTVQQRWLEHATG